MRLCNLFTQNMSFKTSPEDKHVPEICAEAYWCALPVSLAVFTTGFLFACAEMSFGVPVPWYRSAPFLLFLVMIVIWYFPHACKEVVLGGIKV